MKNGMRTAGLIIACVMILLSLSRAQENDSSDVQELTLGIFYGLDVLHADMDMDWVGERENPRLYFEDTKRAFQKSGGHILILDVFMDWPLGAKTSIQARFGFAMGELIFLPESDVMVKYHLVKLYGVSIHAVGGIFFQQWSSFSHYAWGPVGGIRLDPLPLEFTIQKPVFPLEYGWRSKYGGYVKTPVHTWLWRVGLMIPVWKSGD